MEKYDVGIIGLWSGCNYGSIATYYALNQVITSMNKSVLMIDKPILTENDVELKETHSRIFGKKHYNISAQYRLNELSKLNSLCDAFLIGSDQVWNYGISKNFGKYFYFDFVENKKKKIAYAVSFGHGIDFAPPEKREEIAKYMSRFDGISTREADGVRICRDSYGINAQQVLDPVFLADPDIYKPLIDESKMEETEPFLATYILDPTPEKRDAILHLAHELGNVKVVNMLDGLPWTFEKNKKLMDLPNCIPNLKVEDWLYYISHCKFLLTDSCHGASFAIIFKKNFIAITNRHRGISRFKSLSELFHVENKIVSDPLKILTDSSLLKSIDYDSIDKIMQSERTRCSEWLKNKLDQPKKSKEELINQNMVLPDINFQDSIEIKNIIKEKSVMTVVQKRTCTGCSACEQVCPKSAIKMKENSEGFLYPDIDTEKCVDCGLCIKKCVSENPVYKNVSDPKCYAMMADDDIRHISSSGGMFTVAAEHIIDNGGYVCGAAYRDDFTVEHIIVNKKEDLKKLRGSKYMQSHMGNVYAEIKKLLDDDKLVLFTGMPCQVAGLYASLDKEYEKLYTIDLLCHGITSSKVFEKYHHDVLESKPLKRLEFKEKEPWGWHAGINAYFEDGTKYSVPLERDRYFIAYLKSIAKNTTCEVCKANRLPRQGDLTMGDFWGIAKHDTEVYDGKGTSVVLANNSKGEVFFDKLKPSIKKWKEEPLDVAIRGNRIIKAPYKLHKNRQAFFDNFDKLDFSELTMGCFRNRLYEAQKKQLLKTVPEQDHELYYLAKLVAEKSNGRQIVTWLKSPRFESVLKKYFDRSVSFYVSKDPKKINGKTVFPIANIKGKSSQYYLAAIAPGYNADNYKLLAEYGYTEIKDFVFRNHKPIVIEKYDLANGRYEDQYGNTIEGYTGVIGKIVLRGGNNHIILGDKIRHTENMTFDLSVNAYVEFGAECSVNAPSRFVVTGTNGNSKIVVKEKCRFTDALVRVYNHEQTSSILINDSCTFETDLELHANSGKKIIIGRDCMFSHDIDLWAGDGHSVFDVTTGKNINSDYDNLPAHKNQIVIGEHVWVAKGAFIMHGTNIGNGSVVGAMSVVKGIYPNNCTIAGNPASMVKKDVAWSRHMLATDINTQCGRMEYVRKTDVIEKDNRESTKRKVLILGGTGRMSSELTSLCINNNDDVTIAVRGKHKLDNIDPSVKVLIFDRLNEDATRKNLSGKYYDVIFDCSGLLPKSVDWVLSTVQTQRYIYTSSFGTYAHYRRGKDFTEDMLPITGKQDYETNITFKDKDWYPRAKYNTELLIANKFPHVNYAIVRIPYVMSLDDDYDDELSSRVFKYVSAVINGTSINGNNLDRQYSFVENKDEANFLLYLSKNNFKGVVNFASIGSISMRQVINYVEEKTNKKAIFDDNAERYPFTIHPEATISVDKSVKLGYTPKTLDEWMYKKIDKYIEHCNLNSDNDNSKIKIDKWLITGGDSEFGKDFVKKLLDHGYTVAATSRDANKLNDLPESVIKIQLDVRDLESCKNAVKIASEKMGSIDVLVNNAGLSHTSNFEETPQEVGEAVIETNFWGTANMIKAILPHMRNNKNGTIINISSASGFRARNYGSYYVASKFAVENLTKNIKFECQRFLRAMSIEIGDMDNVLMQGLSVTDTTIPEYKNLSPLYPYKKGYRNKVDKIIDAIIDVTNRKELPRDLILGWDAYQQFPQAMEVFERETEQYKSVSITTDDVKQSTIKIEDITMPRNPKLKIQNWLITGASGGFGRVLALRLHELGYTVAVTSRSMERLKSLPDDIIKIESQLENKAECERVTKEAIEKMGSIDVLVNNAASDCWCSYEECPYDIMKKVFYVNYTLPQYMIKAVLPHFRSNANGNVINITSIAGIQARARVSTYSAAKAALEGLTRVLKSECQRFARFMAVELVAMRTRIMFNNPVIDPEIDEYKNLGRYSPNVRQIPNKKDITAQQIINVINQDTVPQSLLIGTESYMIAKNEIEQARKDYEDYKDVTLSVCEEIKN